MSKRQSRPKRDDRTFHGRPKRDRKRLRVVRKEVSGFARVSRSYP